MISLEDPVVRRRAAEAVERIGWNALTLEELGRALGVSRVTLYRQGIAKHDVLEALRDYLSEVIPRSPLAGADAVGRRAGASRARARRAVRRQRTPPRTAAGAPR